MDTLPEQASTTVAAVINYLLCGFTASIAKWGQTVIDSEEHKTLNVDTKCLRLICGICDPFAMCFHDNICVLQASFTLDTV